MSEQEINITIAEACGWKSPFQQEWLREYDMEGNDVWAFCGTDLDGDRAPLPNYCNSLDAMHEAEKLLLAGLEDSPESSEVWSDYQTNLIIASPVYLSYHSTPRQRAEAFLRTIGRWEEAKK